MTGGRGGAAGAWVGIMSAGASAPTLTKNGFTIGPSGLGGASSGNPGLAGVQKEVHTP